MKQFLIGLSLTLIVFTGIGCGSSNKSQIVVTPLAYDEFGNEITWLKQVITNSKDSTGVDTKQISTFILDKYEGLVPYDPQMFGDMGIGKHWMPAAIYGGSNILAAHELRPNSYRSNSTVNQSGASSARSNSSAKTKSNADADSISDSQSDSKSDSNSASNADSNSNSDSNAASNSNAAAKTNQSQGQGQRQGQDQNQRQGQDQKQGQDQTSRNNLNQENYQENTQKQDNTGPDRKPYGK